MKEEGGLSDNWYSHTRKDLPRGDYTINLKNNHFKHNINYKATDYGQLQHT